MTGRERIARLRRLARDLGSLRVGATLVQLLPSASLRVADGRTRRIVGWHPAADLRPCQLRAIVRDVLGERDGDDLVCRRRRGGTRAVFVSVAPLV